jgi:heparan-alpha-glucosaminide N-acetyltransferase
MTAGTAPSSPPLADGAKAISAMNSAKKPERLLSLDAYRGFIMLTLAAAGFGTIQMAHKFPDSMWPDLARQFSHTPWQWGVFWDLIMPAFMFMVGVAMPLSYARRARDGDSFGRQCRHAVVRAAVLCLLGMMLMGQNARFLNVLTQIGLGYVFVFLLLQQSFRVQVWSVAVILAGYWLLFALYPLPGHDYNFAAVGLKRSDLLPGFWAHWSKNVNVAADFDRWLLNLFPQDKPFSVHVGSVQTLNFIPAIANMILGVMSGRMLLGEQSPSWKLRWLFLAGAACMVVGVAAGCTICPVVKRIWTPSFALYSGAWTLWMLAGFYFIIEILGWRRWTFPLVVLGTNSLAVYIMTLLWPAWIGRMLRVQFGADLFSGTYGPVWEKCTVLLILWLFCWWLYRQRLFFRI